MSEQVYLAIDLGAESGRVMAGSWNGRAMCVEELHRFPNGPIALAGTLRWDVLRLWAEILHGLTMAAKRFGEAIVSVGVDTWGVDFVLLTKNGEILGQPYHYRDARVTGMLKRAFGTVSRAEIFAQTGLQFMELLRAARVRLVVVGHDFRFGRGGEASAQWCAERRMPRMTGIPRA